MAKKAKNAKKSVQKNRSTSYNAHHHEQNSFILIAGGGLVVLLLVIFTLSGFGSTQVDKVKESVTEQVQDAKTETKEVVVIKDFTYGPETLRVKAGTTVIFTNEDFVSHNAAADDGSFDTGLLAKGESGSVTFTTPGTYTYHCTPHPTMTGTIIVEE